MSDAAFTHDVFLSHSSKDKDVVRAVAERLRTDGLRVWFDDWEIKPGDSIPVKIEDGLEHSRVLVLCMSEKAFGSDWAQLESGTFRFRDPLNKERRFIPLRLDTAPIKGSLAQFLYINWLPEGREQAYAKLLEACRPLAKPPAMEAEDASELLAEKAIQLGGQNYAIRILDYAFSPDGKRVLTGGRGVAIRLWDVDKHQSVREFYGHSRLRGKFSPSVVASVVWRDNSSIALSGGTDCLVLIWNVDTGNPIRALTGHTGTIKCVELSADCRQVVSGSFDGTIRLWELQTGTCLRVLEGHSGGVHCVAWSDLQRRIFSGSFDTTIRVWDTDTGECLRILEGHNNVINCIAWSEARQSALSGSDDNDIRHWNVSTGRCLHVLKGHRNHVNCLAWNSDNRYALSGSADKTLRLWNCETGRCLCVLVGHTSAVRSVAWSTDQCYALSGDIYGAIRVWNLSEFVTEARAPKVSVPALRLAPEQVQYTNAKVLLVGDSGVGKSGLSNYLAHGIKVEDDKPIPSTDGAWATHWPLRHTGKKTGAEREIWLWDFAGQVDYRLVHQLFMDDTAAAVLVFNPQNENPFEGLGHWDRDLQKAARKPFAKLLAAGRVDRGGLVRSGASMKKFMAERSFLPPLHLTSAKTGDGCHQLRETIVKAIDWRSIPETTSPALYHRMKQEILTLRDNGLVLIRLAELKQRMEMTLRGEDFELPELEAVVSLLAGPGIIQRLDFGGFILLRPEVLSRYAAAVVRKVRKHPQEMGCIREDELLAGHLDYQDFKRLPREDEAVVLRTLLETIISRAWCLRQPCDGTAMLTFPSYFRRERKEQPSHPSVLVTYRFDGPTDDIYATLVVRLHHTVAFESTDLWKSAADFKTQTATTVLMERSSSRTTRAVRPGSGCMCSSSPATLT